MNDWSLVPANRTTAPASLPAYGMNAREVAAQYDLPTDYYVDGGNLMVINRKYTHDAYHSAVDAYERERAVWGGNMIGSEARRLRECIATEQRKCEDRARASMQEATA